MKFLLTLFIAFVMIVILGFAVMGSDRTSAYAKGGRKVTQQQIDSNVPTSVKIKALVSTLMDARKSLERMQAESAISHGKITTIKRQIEELESELIQKKQQYQGGKKLLAERKPEYNIGSEAYSLKELDALVRSKAASVKATADELASLGQQLKNYKRLTLLQDEQINKLSQQITEEESRIARLEQRHQHSQQAKHVATIMQDFTPESEHTFIDSAYREIRDAAELDVAETEAATNGIMNRQHSYRDNFALIDTTDNEGWENYIQSLDKLAGLETQKKVTSQGKIEQR